MPGQTHWHGRINFGHGEGAKGAISNLLAQRGGLDRGGLVGTKESIVEMGVVQLRVGGFGFLTINALHAVLGQKMRREQVFLLACGL